MNALRETLRPYVAINGLNAIVATEDGEDAVLAASEGVAKRDAAKFYGKNGGIVKGTRYTFESSEHFTSAKDTLDAKNFPSSPRNKLAF